MTEITKFTDGDEHKDGSRLEVEPDGHGGLRWTMHTPHRTADHVMTPSGKAALVDWLGRERPTTIRVGDILPHEFAQVLHTPIPEKKEWWPEWLAGQALKIEGVIEANAVLVEHGPCEHDVEIRALTGDGYVDGSLTELARSISRSSGRTIVAMVTADRAHFQNFWDATSGAMDGAIKPIGEIDFILRDAGYSDWSGSAEDRVRALIAQRDHAEDAIHAVHDLLNRDTTEERDGLDSVNVDIVSRVSFALEEGKRAIADLRSMLDMAHDALDEDGETPRGEDLVDRIKALITSVDGEATAHADIHRILTEAGFTKGSTVSRVHEVVGKLAAMPRANIVRAMSEALARAEANEKQTRARMTSLGEEFKGLQKRYHEALRANEVIDDRMQQRVSALEADRDAWKAVASERGQVLSEVEAELPARVGLSISGGVRKLVEKAKALDTLSELMERDGYDGGATAPNVTGMLADARAGREAAAFRDTALADIRKLQEELAFSERVSDRTLDDRNALAARLAEMIDAIHGEGYTTDNYGKETHLGLLMEALAHAKLGRALRDLEAQILRLRELHDDSMGFGLGASDVADAVNAEVVEVRAEEPGSPAARRETAGVLATAVHLVRVHGWNLHDAMADEAERLRMRLDWKEHGKTWPEAKRLVEAGYLWPKEVRVIRVRVPMSEPWPGYDLASAQQATGGPVPSWDYVNGFREGRTQRILAGEPTSRTTEARLDDLEKAMDRAALAIAKLEAERDPDALGGSDG